ncbi:hypothetical protein J1D01_10510 [Seonamhaeicola sp. NFXS20]|uniref:hypothetical protein n=1 Tax=Seonamhaeicola sp. NFXS20 TaxID=2816959 RepID=UPI003B8CEE43
MIKADAKQKQIIAILTRGDKEFKAQLVVNMTGDSLKSSTSDLTFAQANAIIKQLGGSPVPNKWTRFDGNKGSHRNILSLLMQNGWQFYHKEHQRYYADMNAFGGWLQTKAPVKKPLVDMEPYEVSKTIHALKQMFKKDANKSNI